MGIFFSFKYDLIFLTIISPSVLPISVEDFKSDFSSGKTFSGIPSVAIIEAARDKHGHFPLDLFLLDRCHYLAFSN